MADFIKRDIAGMSWYPKAKEWIEGQVGFKTYRGQVLPSKKNPLKPAIFSRYGYVGCFVLCEDGKRRALNELRPIF